MGLEYDNFKQKTDKKAWDPQSTAPSTLNPIPEP